METGRYRGRFILRPKILDPEMGILRRNHKNGAELSPGHPVQEGEIRSPVKKILGPGAIGLRMEPPNARERGFNTTRIEDREGWGAGGGGNRR